MKPEIKRQLKKLYNSEGTERVGLILDDGEVVDKNLAGIEKAKAEFVEVVLVGAIGRGVGGDGVSVGLP